MVGLLQRSGDGDTTLQGLDVDDKGTTLWAWTGEDKDTVESTTELFELEIMPSDERPATDAWVLKEHPFKVRFGSSTRPPAVTHPRTEAPDSCARVGGLGPGRSDVAANTTVQ